MTPESSSPEEGESGTSDLPTDAAGWRAVLSAIPARALLKLIHKDKVRAAHLLAGFRPGPDMLRHPQVQSRLVEEALHQPAFARELAEWTPPSPSLSVADAEPTPPEPPAEAAPVPSKPVPPTPPSDERLRDKIKEQRGALRDKDARIAELEAALVREQRARNAARQEAEQARGEAAAAHAQTDRLRRQRERELRQVRAPAEEASRTPPRRKDRIGPTPAPPAATEDSLWTEALRRLALRGRHETVIAVCREALAAADSADSATHHTGVVHALLADALHAQGNGEAGAENDQAAAAAFLDTGEVLPASESLARALRTGGRPVSVPLLRRLLGLARRLEQTEAVGRVFARLRGTAPGAFRGFRDAVAALGPSFASFLEAIEATGGPVVGMDETLSLPTGGIPALTPRRLLEAVASGDVALVTRARVGIAALQETNAPLANALLAAVSGAHPDAVVPLTQATHPIVVDASNVARHDPDPLALSPRPRVEHLVWMRDFLLRRGFFPIVMLADANLRFHVDDRAAYQALIEHGVLRETPPATSADAALIAEARERRAPLVTNDRLWDWAEAEDIERIGFGIFQGSVSFTSF